MTLFLTLSLSFSLPHFLCFLLTTSPFCSLWFLPLLVKKKESKKKKVKKELLLGREKMHSELIHEAKKKRMKSLLSQIFNHSFYSTWVCPYQAYTNPTVSHIAQLLSHFTLTQWRPQVDHPWTIVQLAMALTTTFSLLVTWCSNQQHCKHPKVHMCIHIQTCTYWPYCSDKCTIVGEIFPEKVSRPMHDLKKIYWN